MRSDSVAMTFYDSDESDDPWDTYGSWDYDDPNDDYWYDQYDQYGDGDDEDEEQDDDVYDNDDPWDNTLSQQEECDIITETIKIHKMNIKKYGHHKLRYFTVRGEGLFECGGCANRWTSHNATIKVDLFKKFVSRKFTQRCKYCPNQWATPLFTDDRFEEIMDKVAEKHESRLEEDEDNEQPVFIAAAAGNGKPHLQQYCEKCQELGKPCWKYVIDAAR